MDRSTPESCVLLVDDDEAVRGLMERLLQAAGLTVISAGDPVDAARKYRSCTSRVAALVTDLDLPRISGLELAAVLVEVDPELPVLIVSGAFSRYPDSLEQITARGWRWLAKPFSPGTLVSMVRAAIGTTEEPQRVH
ncbi:MAG TPA: response regulator [Bryobacteraceae bacterium]|nr:response regulator [Bryobacteraceae bacterium]